MKLALQGIDFIPVMESVPGAVATGSQLIQTIEIARMVTRSHPPPHAGCPRGDPGPLPVLTSSSNQDYALTSRLRNSPTSLLELNSG